MSREGGPASTFKFNIMSQFQGISIEWDVQLNYLITNMFYASIRLIVSSVNLILMYPTQDKDESPCQTKPLPCH